MQVQYPPTRGVPFRACAKFIKTGHQCYICFNRDKFHLEVGCPVFAEHDLVIIKDPVKAKSIREEFKARPPPKGRAPRGQHAKKGGQDSPTPPPPTPIHQPPGTPAQENPSAHRATSLEPPTRFSPPPIPPSGFEDDNYWARAGCEYFDGDDIAFDPDDDNAFEYNWADVPYANEPAAEEHKTNADFSNYYITASARRSTAKHVSAALTSVAHKALKSPNTIISKPVNLGVQCCANSGATDHMFPDRHAFISYHPTPNCFVELGDGTKLRQMGKGSAKIMLNDKVILLRNVLHVPQLQEPLYSLRRHSQMPECGYFSSFDTGSHLLFPTSVLEIDTSIDNILDFQSIGASHSSGLDYAEPREYPQPKARPATIIPPDNDTLDHLSVSFRIPTPKSGSPPPIGVYH
jgi:hypothetical protein